MPYDFFCCNCNRGVDLNSHGRCSVCGGDGILARQETYTPPELLDPFEFVYRPTRGLIAGIILFDLAVIAAVLLAARGC